MLKVAGLGGSVGCASDTGDQEVAGSTPAGPATFFYRYGIDMVFIQVLFLGFTYYAKSCRPWQLSWMRV